MKKNIISIIFILCGLLLSCIVAIFLFIFNSDDSDYCIEDGDCPEGYELKINNNNFIVNKQSCKKYNGIWNNQKRICKFNFNDLQQGKNPRQCSDKVKNAPDIFK